MLNVISKQNMLSCSCHRKVMCDELQGSFPSLYEICIQRIAYLLKYHHSDLIVGNPFSILPSAVVEAIILNVARISTVVPLESSDLHPLLTSGQVRHFLLQDDPYLKPINVSAETVKKLLEDLASSCQNLVTLKLNLVWKDRKNLAVISPALGALLDKARNIEHLESSIEFDVRTVCHSHKIRKLVLTFPLKNNVYDFLGSRGSLRIYTALRHLEIYEDRQHLISHTDIAIILIHCPELIYINRDISKSLEYLHAKELLNGTLSHKYKIQKCHLGMGGRGVPADVVASKVGVLIASLTCPHLKSVQLYINDNQAISALQKCPNLKSLAIKLEPILFRFYTFEETTILLEKKTIGHNLTSLTLLNFEEVDFSLIGKCCPNLEILKVEYVTKIARSSYSPTAFQNLHLAEIRSRQFFDCEKDILIGILSNSVNLRQLVVVPAGNFTDEVLETVLKNNSLSNLKSLYFSKCGLTKAGWQNLATNLGELRIIKITRVDGEASDIKTVIREINPAISIGYW